jgi:uncharacterized membrane protein YkvA (DUF1232 family)
MSPLLVAIGAVVVLWLAVVGGLALAGRRDAARVLAGFVPGCLVLCRRLLGDPRVSRTDKVLLGALIGYLALPIDLVPDFLPVVGQLDDAILVVLVLRRVVRRAGSDVVAELWPGPAAALRPLLALAGLHSPVDGA